jgi:DNA-binding XRE family transcriptional regulator
VCYHCEMRLDVWLTLHKIQKKTFAQMVGIERSSLHHILSGNRLPSEKIAKKIYSLTQKKVKLKTLKPIEDWNC